MSEEEMKALVEMKIKNLGTGMIVWKGATILGIKGATLDERYNDYECYQIGGIDYEIKYTGTLKKLKQERGIE